MSLEYSRVAIYRFCSVCAVRQKHAIQLFNKSGRCSHTIPDLHILLTIPVNRSSRPHKESTWPQHAVQLKKKCPTCIRNPMSTEENQARTQHEIHLHNSVHYFPIFGISSSRQEVTINMPWNSAASTVHNIKDIAWEDQALSAHDS